MDSECFLQGYGMTNITDKQLVKDLQAGKENAYEDMVIKYTDKVYALASRFVRNQEDAEEVLQDVFVTVYRKIKAFEGKSSFSSWLYRVTVNAALMKIRKKKQDRSVSIEEMSQSANKIIEFHVSEKEGADFRAYRKELLREMETAVERLPEEYRPVFILRDIDGLSSSDVSQILSISIPAVKSRLHRSRLMLRKRLEDVYNEYTHNPVEDRRAVG